MKRLLPRLLLAPAVLTLLMWMIVPLVMTIYFSLIRYNLMQPEETGFAGLENFEYFLTDPSFIVAVVNTLLLLGSVIVITVLLGIVIALLIDSPFPGRGVVRLLLISPFFVMPTVNALLWKHMMMNPIYGVLAQVWMFFGAEPVDWLTNFPLLSVIIMVAWQWLPFATAGSDAGAKAGAISGVSGAETVVVGLLASAAGTASGAGVSDGAGEIGGFFLKKLNMGWVLGITPFYENPMTRLTSSPLGASPRAITSWVAAALCRA